MIGVRLSFVAAVGAEVAFAATIAVEELVTEEVPVVEVDRGP